MMDSVHASAKRASDPSSPISPWSPRALWPELCAAHDASDDDEDDSDSELSSTDFVLNCTPRARVTHTAADERMKRYVLMRRVFQLSRRFYEKAKDQHSLRKASIKHAMISVHRGSRTINALNDFLRLWNEERKKERERSEYLQQKKNHKSSLKARELEREFSTGEEANAEHDWDSIHEWLSDVQDTVMCKDQEVDFKHMVNDMFQGIADDNCQLYQQSQALVTSCKALEDELECMLKNSRSALEEGEALSRSITQTTDKVQSSLASFLAQMTGIQEILEKQKAERKASLDARDDQRQIRAALDSVSQQSSKGQIAGGDSSFSTALGVMTLLAKMKDNVKYAIDSEKHYRKKRKGRSDTKKKTRDLRVVTIATLAAKSMVASSKAMSRTATEEELPIGPVVEDLPESPLPAHEGGELIGDDQGPDAIARREDECDECVDEPTLRKVSERRPTILPRKLVVRRTPQQHAVYRDLIINEQVGEDFCLRQGVRHMQFRTRAGKSKVSNHRECGTSLSPRRIISCKLPGPVSRSADKMVHPGTYINSCKTNTLQMGSSLSEVGTQGGPGQEGRPPEHRFGAVLPTPSLDVVQAKTNRTLTRPLPQKMQVLSTLNRFYIIPRDS